MAASIAKSTNAMKGSRVNKEVRAMLDAARADLVAIRAEVAKLVTDVGVLDTGLDTMATKLNADATVTDTNYAGATAAMTAAAPAALTLTA